MNSKIRVNNFNKPISEEFLKLVETIIDGFDYYDITFEGNKIYMLHHGETFENPEYSEVYEKVEDFIYSWIVTLKEHRESVYKEPGYENCYLEELKDLEKHLSVFKGLGEGN